MERANLMIRRLFIVVLLVLFVSPVMAKTDSVSLYLKQKKANKQRHVLLREVFLTQFCSLESGNNFYILANKLHGREQKTIDCMFTSSEQPSEDEA